MATQLPPTANDPDIANPPATAELAGSLEQITSEETPRSKGVRFECFTYDPTPDGRQIRLLDLQPYSGVGPISCKMRFAALDDAPSYEAISYAWGDPADTVDIICNGKTLDIPRSLSAALRRVSHRNKTRVVWADAVCIDQSNLKERSHQVTMMGTIYRNARTVLIWLGEDADGSAAHVFPWITAFATDKSIVTAADVSAVLSETDSSVWTRFVRILRYPWWYRLWAFQEIGLAARAVAFCGPCEIDYWHLELCLRALRFEGYSIANRHRIPAETLHHRMGTFREPVDAADAGRNHLFFEVLRRARSLQCTDPRDKVYAILGHPSASRTSSSISTTTGSKDDPRPFLDVNYAHSPLDVYRNLTLAMLRQHSALQILSAIEHPPTGPVPTPSWIPDWSRPKRSRELARLSLAYRADAGAPPPRVQTFSSTSGMVATATGEPAVTLLKVAGVRFAPVVWRDPCTRPLLLLSSPLASSSSGFALAREVAGRPPTPRSQIARLWAAVWRDAERLREEEEETLGEGGGEKGQMGVKEEPARMPREDRTLEAFYRTLTANCSYSYLRKTDQRGIAHAVKRFLAYLEAALEGGGGGAEGAAEADAAAAESSDEVSGDEAGVGAPADGGTQAEVEFELAPETEAKSDADAELDAEVLVQAVAAVRKRLGVHEEKSDDVEATRKPRRSEWWPFVAAAARSCEGRSFFVAGEKRAFGLGPAGLEVGDVVAVLFGSKVPFVLRPVVDGTYKMIGECYVDGIMAGRVVDQWLKGLREKEDFVLS